MARTLGMSECVTYNDCAETRERMQFSLLRRWVLMIKSLYDQRHCVVVSETNTTFECRVNCVYY